MQPSEMERTVASPSSDGGGICGSPGRKGWGGRETASCFTPAVPSPPRRCSPCVAMPPEPAPRNRRRENKIGEDSVLETRAATVLWIRSTG